ncbi:MAG: helix-turn-helix transcriptional regulator [Stellaceae bacterium]
MRRDLSREQCRAGRALLDWSQAKLADAANIARQTVVDFERGARTPYPNNLDAIGLALEAAGVLFVSDGEASQSGGPGVRLAKRKRKR